MNFIEFLTMSSEVIVAAAEKTRFPLLGRIVGQTKRRRSWESRASIDRNCGVMRRDVDWFRTSFSRMNWSLTVRAPISSSIAWQKVGVEKIWLKNKRGKVCKTTGLAFVLTSIDLKSILSKSIWLSRTMNSCRHRYKVCRIRLQSERENLVRTFFSWS